MFSFDYRYIYKKVLKSDHKDFVGAEHHQALSWLRACSFIYRLPRIAMHCHFILINFVHKWHHFSIKHFLILYNKTESYIECDLSMIRNFTLLWTGQWPVVILMGVNGILRSTSTNTIMIFIIDILVWVIHHWEEIVLSLFQSFLKLLAL